MNKKAKRLDDVTNGTVAGECTDAGLNLMHRLQLHSCTASQQPHSHNI